MKFARRQAQTQGYWRLDGMDVAVLMTTLPRRGAELTLTVPQVGAFIQAAQKAGVKPLIGLRVSRRDIDVRLLALAGHALPNDARVTLTIPAGDIEDFLDNAVLGGSVQTLTVGELLDGWPMQHARLMPAGVRLRPLAQPPIAAQ